MALLTYDSSSDTLVQFFFQVILHTGQALQQQRVKRSALAVQDHLHSFFVGKCFLNNSVHSSAHHTHRPARLVVR